jgi:predicted Rossmann-fold nucleotide-binding protein
VKCSGRIEAAREGDANALAFGERLKNRGHCVVCGGKCRARARER